MFLDIVLYFSEVLDKQSGMVRSEQVEYNYRDDINCGCDDGIVNKLNRLYDVMDPYKKMFVEQRCYSDVDDVDDVDDATAAHNNDNNNDNNNDGDDAIHKETEMNPFSTPFDDVSSNNLNSYYDNETNDVHVHVRVRVNGNNNNNNNGVNNSNIVSNNECHGVNDVSEVEEWCKSLECYDKLSYLFGFHLLKYCLIIAIQWIWDSLF